MFGEKKEWTTDKNWSVGRNHSGDNQDSMVLLRGSIGRHQFVFAGVCDGIGSLEGGEFASGVLVRRIRSWFLQEGMTILYRRGRWGLPKLRNSLMRCVYQVQAEMKHFAEKQKGPLGTTCALVILWDHIGVGAAAGDSGIYLKTKDGGAYLFPEFLQGKPLTNCICSMLLPHLQWKCFRAADEIILHSDGGMVQNGMPIRSGSDDWTWIRLKKH